MLDRWPDSLQKNLKKKLAQKQIHNIRIKIIYLMDQLLVEVIDVMVAVKIVMATDIMANRLD